MKLRGIKRVVLGPGTDLRRVVEEVHRDKEPRLIERDGEALAVVLDPADYTGSLAARKTTRQKETLLSFAGIWRDLDAEHMIADVYRARRDAQPSPPVEL